MPWASLVKSLPAFFREKVGAKTAVPGVVVWFLFRNLKKVSLGEKR